MFAQWLKPCSLMFWALSWQLQVLTIIPSCGGCCPILTLVWLKPSIAFYDLWVKWSSIFGLSILLMENANILPISFYVFIWRFLGCFNLLSVAVHLKVAYASSNWHWCSKLQSDQDWSFHSGVCLFMSISPTQQVQCYLQRQQSACNFFITAG